MALTPLEQRIAKQVDKIPIPEVALRFGIKIEPDQNMICPFPGIFIQTIHRLSGTIQELKRSIASAVAMLQAVRSIFYVQC